MGTIARVVNKIHYGDYCYIFIENFPQKFSPCMILHTHQKMFNAYPKFPHTPNCAKCATVDLFSGTIVFRGDIFSEEFLSRGSFFQELFSGIPITYDLIRAVTILYFSNLPQLIIYTVNNLIVILFFISYYILVRKCRNFFKTKIIK